jgi:predicted Zn finger-like uncharacterized protein
MIIECEKCGTKYSFDESLIVGEGARVRCSRCKNVFFQENPSRERVSPPIEVMEEKESSRAEIEEETAEQELKKEAPDFDDSLEEKEPVDTELEEKAEEELEEEAPYFDDSLEEQDLIDTELEEKAEDELEKEVPYFNGLLEEQDLIDAELEEKAEEELEKEVPYFNDLLEEQDLIDAELQEKAERKLEKEFLDFNDLLEEKGLIDTELQEKPEEELEKEASDFDDSLEEKEPVDTELKGDKEKKKTKRHLWTPGKVIAYIVILILVLGGVYMLIFPQMGKEVLDNLSRYMSTDNIEKKDTGTTAWEGSVNFTNVKERLVKNFILGDLLVIQGAVVNKYDYPISKVKVRGKILNAAKEILDEVEFYCGNLLTDEELGHLTGEEITKELSTEIGSDISNDNIAPEGEIPFMIVFTNPPKEAVEFIVELAKDSRPYKK